jgi:hypothetical protein
MKVLVKKSLKDNHTPGGKNDQERGSNAAKRKGMERGYGQKGPKAVSPVQGIAQPFLHPPGYGQKV